MELGLNLQAIILFCLATTFLLLGHSVRVRRWNLLLPPSPTDSSSPQFAALSIGYVLNFILPFRVGELVRCAVLSFVARKDFAVSVSSVLIERAIDVAVWICIAMVAGMLAVPSWDSAAWDTSFWIIAFATAGLLLLAWSVGAIPLCRRTINTVVYIFNDEIRFTVHHWLWTYGETFQRLRRKRGQFLWHTILMWFSYLAAYVLLARCLRITVAKMTSVFFLAPWEATAWTVFHMAGLKQQLAIALFAVGPVAFIACYLFVSRKYKLRPQTVVQWFSDPALYLGHDFYRRRHYINEEQYRGFLRRTFAGEYTLLTQFDDLRTEANTVLHRVFHGGSDALTALVQVDDTLTVRKFAAGAGYEKLAAQCKWLQEHRANLPLVPVTQIRENDGNFSYDMPYWSSSRQFFEVIHTSTEDASWAILQSLLNKISDFHRDEFVEVAPLKTVEEYVETKLRSNFEKVIELAPLLFQEESILVNGTVIDTGAIRQWIYSEDVASSFRHRSTSVIHGDLTIENVLVNPDFEDGWFLIDPNVGNIFESPMIDYAKLLQSLHLGYESLHKDAHCTLEENEVRISMHRTSQYARLFEKYNEWLRQRLGEDGLREVRLHEIFHYFRLTPYKFRRSPNSGMTFAACALLLAEQYLKEFGKC